MQKIYVIGGSNSLMKAGWVSKMKTDYQNQLEVVNLSIGAATSLMAIYRILSGEIPDGSTVVWEYALNESNHFKNGQSVESLIHGINWLMTLCERRCIKFIPIIFWTLDQANSFEYSPYYKRLFSTFLARGINPLDFGEVVRNIADRGGHSISEMYSDNLHYAVTGEVITSICELVFSGLSSAKVPGSYLKLAGKDLLLVRPEAAQLDNFRSGVVSCSYYTLREGIYMPANGMLLASYVVASQSGGGMSLVVDDGMPIPYSLMTLQREKPPFRVVKHLVHMHGNGVGIPVESFISVSKYSDHEKPIVQNMFAWYPEKASSIETDDGFIAALLEV